MIREDRPSVKTVCWPWSMSLSAAHGEIDLALRRALHVGVTRHPTDAWVTPQPREATPLGQYPKQLMLDNNSTCGPTFAS